MLGVAGAPGTPWCDRLVLPPIVSGGVIDPSLRTRARRRVRGLLREVPPPRPWSMNDWIDRLERHRGRDIDLLAVRYAPGRPSGAWQRHDSYDLVAYAAGTSTLHQDHIIAHEIAHLLCEHRGECVLSEAEAARLAPDLSAHLLSHLLTRVTTDSDEYEAELMAVLLMSAATADEAPLRPGASGPAADRARRFASVLG
ncbi:hypothetical protein GCM10022222_76000 [Amycolatopsis ultiminotia]|uniref:IrrE N-terminal-like domain-containing protein n=2 Tax=Amycolatopsis ultiminotia TaxID=543629 RepID=A0ABP6YAB5_9PSEU